MKGFVRVWVLGLNEVKELRNEGFVFAGRGFSVSIVCQVFVFLTVRLRWVALRVEEDHFSGQTRKR